MSGVNIANPDITLVLDTQGVIREATLANAIASEGVDGWLGLPWPDTVAQVGVEKVRDIVADARTSGISAFRHVIQRFPSGLELPIEYTTVRVSGRKGGLLAMGKSLQAVAELQARLAAAQQATEREYWKLREVETRYRLLFDASNEAVVMVASEDFRVVEANPVAVRALGLLPGMDFMTRLGAPDRDAFRASLHAVRENGRAPGIVLHLGQGGEPWVVRPSLMAADSGLRYLLHLAPASGRPAAKPVADPLSVEQIVDRMPDGFVAIDRAGVILRANRAFLGLVQAGAEGAVIGQKLGRWLSRPGADVSTLIDTVLRHRAVRLLATTIEGELGTATEIEISAVANTDSNPQYFGLLLRDIGRRLAEPAAEVSIASILAVLTEKLGKTPLLEVVRDTSDAVERQFITAALLRADGNRTAAAELLGLSRQSLHTKLNRYGFDGAYQSRAEPPD